MLRIILRETDERKISNVLNYLCLTSKYTIFSRLDNDNGLYDDDSEAKKKKIDWMFTLENKIWFMDLNVNFHDNDLVVWKVINKKKPQTSSAVHSLVHHFLNVSSVYSMGFWFFFFFAKLRSVKFTKSICFCLLFIFSLRLFLFANSANFLFPIDWIVWKALHLTYGFVWNRRKKKSYFSRSAANKNRNGKEYKLPLFVHRIVNEFTWP